MMGIFIKPIIDIIAEIFSALILSSIWSYKSKYPKYKKNKINIEVSRASHAHQVPQIGLPQIAPVIKVINVNTQPISAMARAIK